MTVISAYSTYVPSRRLARSTISEALGTTAGAGSRSVAYHDEDATTMGVEAARGCSTDSVRDVLFATSIPPYLDKTNATAIRAALGLSRHGGAFDMNGSVRSAVAAFRAGLDAAAAGRPTIVVASDVRFGLPGGSDESEGGDGASAFVLGGSEPIALLLGHAAASVEMLERWRVPGEATSSRWEERFAESSYLRLAEDAVADACKEAGLVPEELGHVIVAGQHERARQAVARRLVGQVAPEQPDLVQLIGNTGAADFGIRLADVLDRAGAQETILVVNLADGVDAMVLRATAALATYRAGRPTVRDQIEDATAIAYTTFLSWRGILTREPPRRPDPDRPAAPVSLRSHDWKFAFTGTRCEACGTRHVPPDRVCVSCGTVDQMVPECLADVPASIATYTIDRLAYSLNPPVLVAVVDFEGGGRFQCEMTEVDASAVAIGDPVEMTFRRFFTAGGVHNYFWKARPARAKGAR